ncbi:polysaccharide deacetylase family protein [Solibacillus ferritrahens]|uniref:polysaccharide deacetylase family protein n=1 Tax=Solibacillus ferritrahens TaxID=3098620 RepID=UPI00300B2FC9
MGKKIGLLGILFSFLLVVQGYRFWTDVPSTFAESGMVTISITYSEQVAFDRFINKASSTSELVKPFYLFNGGLTRSIQNCDEYIEVEKILEDKKWPTNKQGNEQSQPISGDNKGKRIALTFDDGPHQSVTNQILLTLQKHEVKATFFVLGQNVVKHPEIVKKADASGHEIANHSWGHKNLTKLNVSQMQEEINRANEAICDAIGKYPTMYRPPFGAINETVREVIELTPVLWNIDTLDWHHKTPAKTLANLKAQAKNDGIILMHDIHQQSAEALEDVILYLKEEGYEFVTTSQLL